MKAIWGNELPHVLKELYGIIPIEAGQSKKRLTLRQSLRLLTASRWYQNGMPYEYCWGHTRFRERDFLVNPAALIPRPETEEWVGRVIDDLSNEALLTGGENHQILDIGTGTGAIALTLAAEFPKAKITAVEISSFALSLAKKNARRLLSSRKNHPRFLYGDIFTLALEKLLPGQEKKNGFDVVVCNPPYVGWKEKETLPSAVLGYEPHIALFAGNDGLEFYRKLAEIISRILRPGGKIYLEIGWEQGEAVKKLFEFMGEGKIYCDMFGKERLFTGIL